jgi:DNA-binding CsgD family transcriptional regulator
MARKNKHCNYFFRLSASLGRLWKSQELLSFSNIRFSRLRYMLIFPLAPVFANMQGKLFETDFRLLGIDAMTLMGSAYCIGAGVIFAFSRARNVTAVARASVLLALLGFIPWIFLHESQASLLFAVMFTFGFGGCAACAAFAYTFGLNNTERFTGAAMISLFCMLMELDYGFSFISGLFSKTYLTILVIGTVICLMSYKAGDFSDAYKRPEGKLNTAVKLMLFFFVAHKLVEIFYTYLPAASTPAALVSNGLVGILVVGLAFAIQMFARRSIWHMCNLFFISMVCAYALYFSPEASLGRELARLFHGFEQMGYIASYYLLGCVFNKHGSFRLFKRTLVIILPGCLLLYMIPGTLSTFFPGHLPLAATATSAVIFVIFILLSPAYSKNLFFSDWSEDFRRASMSDARAAKGQMDRFEGLNLTPREREVAALLLKGHALKQIAIDLDISPDTVKFHNKNLYKKLGISGRSQLFARFGAERNSQL